MERQVKLNFGGLELYVVVEYEDNAVFGVRKVLADTKTDTVEIVCDKAKFFETYEGDLQYAFEEAERDERIAHAEMQMDADREEGRL